jgi:acyl-CoA thioester hydrolase
MSRVTTAIPHTYAIGIEPEDIDFMGHVNNANYLKWVQAAVIDHWQRLAPAEAVAGHLWVALKHEITYRKPAFLNDDVIATVLLEKVQGARAFYETIIKRGEELVLPRCRDAAPIAPREQRGRALLPEDRRQGLTSRLRPASEVDRHALQLPIPIARWIARLGILVRDDRLGLRHRRILRQIFGWLNVIGALAHRGSPDCVLAS